MTPLPQDYRLRQLSLRTVLPLSLSLRGCLQVMPVLNICSFWIHWLGSAALRDPLLLEGVLVWLHSSLTTATSLVPCRKGSFSPIQEPRVLLLPWLRLQKKADSDTHNRPLQRGTSCCHVVAILPWPICQFLPSSFSELHWCLLENVCRQGSESTWQKATTLLVLLSHLLRTAFFIIAADWGRPFIVLQRNQFR